MTTAVSCSQTMARQAMPERCAVAAIWIDYYAYHLSRLRAIAEHPVLRGRVAGIELVGGAGVHTGLRFRDQERNGLPISTLLPDADWDQAGKWQMARALWRKLDQLDPAVILVPGYYTLAALAAAVWGKWHGRSVVLMTESTQQDHRRSFWKELVKRALLRSLFDWAVTGGRPHIRYLRSLGFPAGRVLLPYNVVDNSFFRDRARQLRAGSEPSRFGLPEKYFLYVGRLAEEKNLSLLLEAYNDYRQAGGRCFLVMVGDGPRRDALWAQAARSAYSADIVWAGIKTTAELPPYYAFARGLVLPSIREPWGLVANEALASSLPVVMSNRCGCAEDLVYDGENGFLFDPVRAGELASRLLQLEHLSQAEFESMGRRSLELIEAYSPERWADAVASIAAEARRL